MVISDESITGKAPTNSGRSPRTEYQVDTVVPSGQVYYVESVSIDPDANNGDGAFDVHFGITSAPNGFSDLPGESILQGGRSTNNGGTNSAETVQLGEYAYAGDNIGLSLATRSGGAPYFQVSIRRVV